MQVGEELLRVGSLPDLLPHLLRYDWRTTTEAEVPRLNKLLTAAARLQPEPSLDAVMERVENYLVATQRGPEFYTQLVGWLTALHDIPILTGQVQLFASELWRQHGRRPDLRRALAEAGFAPLPTDEQEQALRRKTATKSEGAPSASPKRRGRTPRLRP